MMTREEIDEGVQALDDLSDRLVDVRACMQILRRVLVQARDEAVDR